MRLYIMLEKDAKATARNGLQDSQSCMTRVLRRETLAAAKSLLRWVLVDRCPVLNVHFSFGLAPHMGQRTDKICRT
jgi:hypothetical protein